MKEVVEAIEKYRQQMKSMELEYQRLVGAVAALEGVLQSFGAEHDKGTSISEEK